MKNILGTLESPETQRKHSRLFPETPSHHAMDIVSRPEWRAAIEYRVNEALYGGVRGVPNRTLGETLFPNFPRSFSAYEDDINAQIFAEEEAVRIDRASAYSESPPTQGQIEIEEGLRRYVLQTVDFIEEKNWASAERLLATYCKENEASKNSELRTVSAAYFNDVFFHLLPQKMREYANRNDMTSALHVIRLMHRMTAIPAGLYTNFVKDVSRSSTLRGQLAKVFLTHLGSPAYADLWKECETYGFSMNTLKKEIRTQCERELCEVLKKNGAHEFFRWLDFAVRLDVFTEEELSTIQSLRTAAAEHVRNIIGKNDQWPKEFRDFLDECQKKHLCAFEDMSSSSVVRVAAEQYLVAAFIVGTDPDALLLAANAIHQAGIMTRSEACTLPRIRISAEQFLERIFSENVLTDDPTAREKIYLTVVKKYVEAGIGTRTYFDNVPAIKAARGAHNTV